MCHGSRPRALEPSPRGRPGQHRAPKLVSPLMTTTDQGEHLCPGERSYRICTKQTLDPEKDQRLGRQRADRADRRPPGQAWRADRGRSRPRRMLSCTAASCTSSPGVSGRLDTRPSGRGSSTTAGQGCYPSLRFEYGLVQVVAHIPHAPGLWPALWLAATNGKYPPEIDMLDSWGSSARRAYSSTH
jgi:hypothetical protein